MPALLVLATVPLHTKHAGAVGVVLKAGMAVALLWRRRAPVAVFGAIWVLAAIQGLLERPMPADVALLVAFYTVASTAETAVTLVTAAGAGGRRAAGGARLESADARQTAWALVSLSAVATAAGVLGVNIRNRRQMVEGLRERARRLEREREQEVALARATERGRIAREMHDVIAHNVSVMVALCDGAGYQVHEHPEQAEAALARASRAGRQALAEMRQLLGVLRENPDQPELAPLPGIREVEQLVEQVRAAGLPVSYTLSGDPSGAPPGMELTVYRIVQEALTNTLKHAGPGARASVALNCESEQITVEVRDSGGTSGPIKHGGAGVRGMSERAAVYGGSLDAGPAADGGWQVSTSLALDGARIAATPAAEA